MKTQSIEPGLEADTSSGIAVNSNRKGILWYLLIAFVLAWVIWEIVIQFGGISVTSRQFGIAAFPSAFAPAIAAFIVRKWITREGFGDAGLRLNLRKWPYYLVAWLLPVVVVGCIVVLAPLLGIGKADFSFVRGTNYLLHFGVSASKLQHPLLLIVNCLIAPLLVVPIHFGEEFGWRGYLQLRLFPQKPVMSAVVTGLIWAVWHYPATLRGYDFPDHPILGSLFVFPVATVLLSIIFGWLRLKSGSTWAPSLAHSATNVFGASTLLFLFGGGLNSLLISYFGLLAWIPLGALSAWIVLTGQLKPANNKTRQTDLVSQPVAKLRPAAE